MSREIILTKPEAKSLDQLIRSVLQLADHWDISELHTSGIHLEKRGIFGRIWSSLIELGSPKWSPSSIGFPQQRNNFECLPRVFTESVPRWLRSTGLPNSLQNGKQISGGNNVRNGDVRIAPEQDERLWCVNEFKMDLDLLLVGKGISQILNQNEPDDLYE